MVELFNKTREQIQLDVSRVCSERRKQAQWSVSGNLLIDTLTELITKKGHAMTDDVLETLRQRGLKNVKKEDLENLSSPLILCLDNIWFLRKPSKSVYVYAPSIKIPGAIKEKDSIWKCPLTDDLVEFYRENSDQMMILDTDIQRIFDVLYTPKEKKKKEIISELASLYD